MKMRTFALSAVAALFIVMGAYVPVARAADEAAGGKGSLKGKVMKPDGSAAAGAEVRLMVRPERARKSPTDAAADPQPKAKPARGAAREVVASATADLNGDFTVSDIPAGKYILAARLKSIGAGRQPVSVQAGSAAEVSLSLKEAAVAKKPGKAAKSDRKAAKAKRKAKRGAAAAEAESK